jgi:hypothetical protein
MILCGSVEKARPFEVFYDEKWSGEADPYDKAE